MEVIFVYVNFPTIDKARQIGTALIEEQLAACVNIIPAMESIYCWEGEIHTEAEVMLIAKTTTGHYRQIEERIIDLHPYSTPEVVAQKLDLGSEKYLKWVREQTRLLD